MIDAVQIRAARVLLGWSQQQLAEAAKLGLSTVKKGEVDVATINGRSIIALEETLTSAGIVFLSDRDDPRIRKGVGLRR